MTRSIRSEWSVDGVVTRRSLPEGVSGIYESLSMSPVTIRRYLSPLSPRFLMGETIHSKFKGHGGSRSKKHILWPRCRGIYGSPSPRIAGTRRFVMAPGEKASASFSPNRPFAFISANVADEKSLFSARKPRRLVRDMRPANAPVFLFLHFAVHVVSSRSCFAASRSLCLSFSAALAFPRETAKRVLQAVQRTCPAKTSTKMATKMPKISEINRFALFVDLALRDLTRNQGIITTQMHRCHCCYECLYTCTEESLSRKVESN